MSYTLNSITLPEGLVWEDPYSWNPVGQQVDVALSGALIVQEARQLQGKPIELIGGRDSCWCTKAEIDQLYALLDTPDLEMQLIIEGETHTVIWDRSCPIKTRAFVSHEAETGSSLYFIDSLKFIKVG